MWFLRTEGGGDGEGAGAVRLYYLRSDKPEVYVGRSAEVSDLVLAGDSSISRRHALISRSEAGLDLQDLGSRYGTFLNEGVEAKTPLSRTDKHHLFPGDVIKFGILHNVWRVREANFITCTSTVKGENLQKLKKDLDSISATIKSEWDDSCTHLTMPSITLTIKVVQALVHIRPIVTAEFWTKCQLAVSDNLVLPDPKDYLPEIIESTLDREQVSFTPDKRRVNIFSDKKFIFFSRKQMNLFKTVLLKASASVTLLSESKMTKAKLCGDNVVVVQFSTGMAGQESQVQQQIINDIVGYLNNKSIRIIPDVEIGLAILYCSTEKYCNPKFSFQSRIVNNDNKLLSESRATILAPETQRLICENYAKTQPPKIIEESLVSLNKDDSDEFYASKEVSGFRSTRERSKRKIDDNEIAAQDRPAKKQSVGNTLMSHNADDDDMFDFVEEIPKVLEKTSTKKVDKKLSFMNARSRKNEDTQEDDMFNFIPDKKEVMTETTNSGENVRKQSLFEIASVKRKAEETDLPHPKKAHKEAPNTLDSKDMKVNVLDLLKNSFWKSCDEEKTKQEFIKNEQSLENISDDTKMDLGMTVVTLRTDLIKRENSSRLLATQNGSSYSGPNFKKFKKVLPLRVQVTIMSKSAMRVYKPDAPAPGTAEHVHSSDDEALTIQNTNERKRHMNY